MPNNFGSLAADREKQVHEWAKEHPMTSFTAEGIVKQLFKKDEDDTRDVTKSVRYKVLVRAYEVACEDLARKQIFKRTSEGVFILNE